MCINQCSWLQLALWMRSRLTHRSGLRARHNPHQRPFTRDELLEASSGADALFIIPFDRLDSEFFKRVPASVKVIATYSVGTHHIDLKAAANKKIAIAYTPGINSDATADIAMLLMLGASRTGARRPGNGAYRNTLDTFRVQC